MSHAPAVKDRQSSSTTSKKTNSYNKNETANKSSSSNNKSRRQPDTSHYQTPISSIQDISKSIKSSSSNYSINNTNSMFQPKLRISQPGDVYEQEADRIAEKVMAMPKPFSYSAAPQIRGGRNAKGKGIDKKCSAGVMKEMEEGKKKEEEKEEELNISRKPSASSSNLEANDQVTNQIRNIIPSSGTGGGSGSSLDSSTKEFMESRFGGDGYYDFSNVRIRTDTQAAKSAESVNALAYTVGNHITFGEGQYSPNTIQGKRLLAHELTHVVQQEGEQTQRVVTQTTEESTKGEKSSKSEKVHLNSLTTAPRGLVARAPDDDEPDINAAEYQKKFAEEIGNGVVTAIRELPLETGSRYVTLPESLLLGPLILGDSGASLTSKIDGWLGGSGKLGMLINKARPKGRVTVTDEKNTWVEDKQGEGPARWFPDVAVEVAQAVHKMLHESLARITPRYIKASVAVGIAAEERTRQSLIQVPAPSPDDIVPSHPIDYNTINVLTQFAKFDYPAYRAVNPDDRGKLGRLRQVSFSWEAPRTGSYWIRVSSPTDPTNEEVAAALYGSPTFAGDVTVSAAPLFGITDATKLLPMHQQTLASLGVDTKTVADPLKEALTGPLHDEVAKNQSTEPSGLLTKADVVRTIDQSLLILDSISTSGARFGMDKGSPVESVNPLKEKLKARRTTLLAGSDEQALTWASQAEAQQRVLTDISFAFDRHVTRLNDLTKMVEDATVKLGGFNLPPYVRTAMLQVAMKFADAAVASELPSSARAILAQAEDRAGTLPIEFLEGALESIQRVIDDARTAKAGQSRWAGYDVGGMQEREQRYKLQLAKLRALIRTDPAAATKEFGEINKLILDLQTESELVGNMDAIDSAWKALDDADSWFIRYLSWSSTSDELRALKTEGNAFHARWSAIHTAWKTGDAKAKEKAKADLDTLRADPNLAAYFGKVKAVVKDAQTEALIGKLVTLLVITVVTAGVGDIVAAGAAGWELGAGATAVAVGGAEAFTFTLLNQVFIDDKHSFGHIVYEFSTNWIMFGAMRRFSEFAKVAELGTVASFGGQAILFGAMTYAKAELDVLIKEGRHLNKEEVKQIALQGIAMYIAMHAIAPAVKPLFADLESSAYTFSAKLKVNNRTRVALVTQANALKGTKDFAEARDYVSAEKTWLEERIKILEEMEAQLKREEADPLKTKKEGGGLSGRIKLNSNDLASLKSELKNSLNKVAGAEQPLLYLEPKAPGLFSAPRENIAEVVKSLGETTMVTEDPATGVKTYEILTPDGTTIKVVEALPPGSELSGTITKPPRLTELPPAEVSRLVYQSSNGTFRLNRKRVKNQHKITGEPEAEIDEHAAREAYAAERAASMNNVEKVFMGQEADRLINPNVPAGTELSADVVGITRQGKYVLIESKGTDILHGLDQLEFSANALGPAQVVRYELVIAEEIRTPGFTVRNNILHLNGNPYTINGKPVHVRSTVQGE